MGGLYLVPDRADMARMGALADAFGCMFEYNDFYEPPVLDDPAGQKERIADYRAWRQNFGQDTIHGAFLDVTVHSSDPLIRDASMLRVRQSVEIAERMGVRGVVFHTGRLAGFREPRYLENWRQVNGDFFGKIAEGHPKLQIYMENMFDEAPDILAGLAERLRSVPNFGICLDYAHAMLTSCPGREWVEALAPYIRHMHINDNDLRGDLHLAVGSGRIDWQEYSGLMREYRIDASVLVEVNGYEAQERSLLYMKRQGIYPFERNGAV